MKDHHRMRAWDGAKLWQYARYTLDGTRVEVSDQPNGCNNDWRGHNECIVELCTGMRDKNGVLIWEGDILKSNLYNRRSQTSDLILDVVIGNGAIYTELKKIIRFNGFSEGVDPGDSELLSSLASYCDLEVIGNIHQTPELLE